MRALQQYRYDGILPYSFIGNKVYFKAADIENLLLSGYLNTSQS